MSNSRAILKFFDLECDPELIQVIFLDFCKIVEMYDYTKSFDRGIFKLVIHAKRVKFFVSFRCDDIIISIFDGKHTGEIINIDSDKIRVFMSWVEAAIEIDYTEYTYEKFDKFVHAVIDRFCSLPSVYDSVKI